MMSLFAQKMMSEKQVFNSCGLLHDSSEKLCELDDDVYMMSHSIAFLQVFNKKDKKDKDRDQRREDSPSHSELDQRTFGDDEGRVSSKDPVSGAKEIQRELASLADKAMDKNMSKLDIWQMLCPDVVVRLTLLWYSACLQTFITSHVFLASKSPFCSKYLVASDIN